MNLPATQDTPQRELTTLQQAFAEAYVTNGDGNAAKAARDAGYTDASAAVTGYRLLQNERVLALIHQLTIKRMASLSPLALRVQQQLMLTARSEFVRQKASSDILDRTGFKPPERHQHLVSGSVTVSIDLGTD